MLTPLLTKLDEIIALTLNCDHFGLFVLTRQPSKWFRVCTRTLQRTMKVMRNPPVEQKPPNLNSYLMFKVKSKVGIMDGNTNLTGQNK
jgi:hypothetical protein